MRWAVLMTPQAPAEEASRSEMTLAQWADLDEDEPGELVDGRLVEEEDAGALHGVVAGWFVRLLESRPGARGGFVLVSDTRFGVAPRRGRKPDTSVYFPGRKPPAQGLVMTPPEIMMRCDRLEKTKEYAAFGVRLDRRPGATQLRDLRAGGRRAGT
jgi:Uma2 family endonuclease